MMKFKAISLSRSVNSLQIAEWSVARGSIGNKLTWDEKKDSCIYGPRLNRQRAFLHLDVFTFKSFIDLDQFDFIAMLHFVLHELFASHYCPSYHQFWSATHRSGVARTRMGSCQGFFLPLVLSGSFVVGYIIGCRFKPHTLSMASQYWA